MPSAPERLQLLLLRLARLIYARAGTIVLLAIFGTVMAGVVAAYHFKVINNINAILDKDSQANRLYTTYKEEFNVDEEYIIVIRGDDPEINREVADELGTRLPELGPGIGTVFYKRDLSALRDRALLLESREALEQMRADVTDLGTLLQNSGGKLGINGLLGSAAQAFSAGENTAEDEEWDQLKPKLTELVTMLEGLAEGLHGSPYDPASNAMPDANAMLAENEYNSVDGGKVLLVLVTPGEREKKSASPYTLTLEAIRGLLTEVGDDYPEVHLGLTGEPVLNDDEMQTAATDATRAALITFGLIIVLFIVGYRERARPLTAAFTLLLAVVWAFAFTMLVVGHLNIISQAFVPMMLGLGIDFGIQILGRYEEELARGKSVLGALEEAMQHTGLAVITGGMITAAAFYTMCFNDFVGLAELGIICGTSIIFCLIVNLIVLPAVFVLRDRNRDLADLQKHAARSAYACPAKLSNNLVVLPWPVIFLAAIGTLVALAGLTKVRFDYNLLNLQNPKLESVKVEKELLDTLGNTSIYAVLTADDMDTVRELTTKLEALDKVKNVNSLVDIVPIDQAQKLPLVEEISGSFASAPAVITIASDVDLAHLRANLNVLKAQAEAAQAEAAPLVGLTEPAYRAMSEIAEEAVALFDRMIAALDRASAAADQPEAADRAATFQSAALQPLAKNISFLKNQRAEPISLEDVPPDLRQRFVGKNGKLMLQIFARENIWERQPLVDFVNELRSVSPDVTGTPVQNYAYIELLRTSYMEAAGWAFLAIVLLIFVHFRNLGYALLAILPLALAVIWTLGAMGWFNIQFNPANIMTLPMVIGIGVAYGVYTVDRYREDGRMDIFTTSTGKAIILSAFTTIFAFGSMLFSNYRGLYSMGQVMTLGVGMCLVASIILLPQILKLMGDTGKLPPPKKAGENKC